jgi:hypothetical protein
MMRHFWCGAWIDDAQAAERLASLCRTGHEAPAEPLDPELVIGACDQLAEAINSGTGPSGRLVAALAGPAITKAEAVLSRRELASFLAADRLRRTLHTELGAQPSVMAPVAGQAAVESWHPLGLLAHVAPANVAIAGPVTLVEGLLSGNVNLVKTSSRQGQLTQRFAAELVAVEPRLAPYVMVLGFESSRRTWLEWMCGAADGVVVWGGEAAAAGVAELVPTGARLVVWGPKISFGYLTAAALDDREVLAALARDVCLMDQRACTSPQVVYVETARSDQLWRAAGRIAEVLSEVAAGYDPPRPDRAEQAEITNTVLVARHEEHLGLTRVWAGPDGSWHVLAETDAALRASPLHRTVLVKPLPREAIKTTLRPMRHYLQTVGVAAADVADPNGSVSALVTTLIAAGADRVTPLGSMHDSYPGEPHDGEYALRRYSRRVTVLLPSADPPHPG